MESVKMFLRLGLCTVFLISISLVYGVDDVSAGKKWKKCKKEQTTVIKLWSEGTPAFGTFVFCPELDEACGISFAERDLDFVFIDWESKAYDITEDDIAALTEFANGLATAEREISFFVRIPPLNDNPEVEPIDPDTATQYIAMVLSVEGVDGVVFPFIRDAEVARQAVSCFTENGINPWSPQNPKGTVISWLMLEDTDAMLYGDVVECHNTPGISVWATGIGTLSHEIGYPGAYLGNRLVLAHSQRVGVANVALAETADLLINRIDQGFLGIIGWAPAWDTWVQEAREYLEEREFDEKEWRIQQREIRNWWKRLLK